VHIGSEQFLEDPATFRGDLEGPAGADPFHPALVEGPLAQRRSDRAGQVGTALRPAQATSDHRPGSLRCEQVDIQLVSQILPAFVTMSPASSATRPRFRIASVAATSR
jgi:hypothetical protein